MVNQDITQYSVDSKYSNKVQDYLGKNSREYGFSKEKGDEVLCFIDDQDRIFAMLNVNKNNLQLANYTNLGVKQGIEKILKKENQN